VAGFISDDVIGCLNLPNSSSRNTIHGTTHPQTEMNLPEDKGRPPRKVENLIAVCEPTIYKIWELPRPINLWAPTTCERDSFNVLQFIASNVSQNSAFGIAISFWLDDRGSTVRVSARLRTFFSTSSKSSLKRTQPADQRVLGAPSPGG
jgi:hypothetical protein